MIFSLFVKDRVQLLAVHYFRVINRQHFMETHDFHFVLLHQGLLSYNANVCVSSEYLFAAGCEAFRDCSECRSVAFSKCSELNDLYQSNGFNTSWTNYCSLQEYENLFHGCPRVQHYCIVSTFTRQIRMKKSWKMVIMPMW